MSMRTIMGAPLGRRACSRRRSVPSAPGPLVENAGMKRYIALLRGINVGKAKRVPMADLRALMESLGYAGVRTLLNSGNAVFDAKAGTAASHAKKLRAAILDTIGVDC